MATQCRGCRRELSSHHVRRKFAAVRAGFATGKKFDKLGYKSIDSAELVFEDYHIPADQLIGGVEGQGFFQATGGLELGRINVAARGVGLSEGSLRLATEYAQARQTMGKPIAEHQAIQLKIGEMVTRARRAATFPRCRCRLRSGRALRHGSRHGQIFRQRGCC